MRLIPALSIPGFGRRPIAAQYLWLMLLSIFRVVGDISLRVSLLLGHTVAAIGVAPSKRVSLTIGSLVASVQVRRCAEQSQLSG